MNPVARVIILEPTDPRYLQYERLKGETAIVDVRKTRRDSKAAAYQRSRETLGAIVDTTL